MIRRELRLIITFKTTTEAMKMERCCKENNIRGRLIPVPKSITAGCGMAWSSPPETKEVIISFMRKQNIHEETVQLCTV